ncbi:MAG: hypothetical protein JO312_12970 [Hyphomicrobiales bacterium]|nr:hypothetical protein [Hyphomicrobiales bacterium]
MAAGKEGVNDGTVTRFPATTIAYEGWSTMRIEHEFGERAVAIFICAADTGCLLAGRKQGEWRVSGPLALQKGFCFQWLAQENPVRAEQENNRTITGQ